MRLFVAVDPGERFRRELTTRLGDWPRRLPLAWVRPENWHLTLSFLGDWPPELLPPLREGLAAAAAGGPFPVRPGAVGAFPDLRRPRVLFLHMEADGRLERLAAAVRRQVELVAAGRQDAKPFRSHLTLARVRRPLPPRLRDLPARIDLGGWEPLTVADFRLVRSRLGPQGPRYEDLATFPLLPGAGATC